MTKKLSPSQKIINRYDRSTGNFADNLREMSAFDIVQAYGEAYGMTMVEAHKVVNHMSSTNDYKGPSKSTDDDATQIERATYGRS